MAQAKTRKPLKFGTCCSQVMGLFLDIHTTKYKDQREVYLGHGRGDEHRAARAARRRVPVHPDRGALPALHGQHLRRRPRQVRFMLECYNREVQGLDDCEMWIHTCWGNPNMQRVIENDSYAASFELYMDALPRRCLDHRDQGPQLPRYRALRALRASCPRRSASAWCSHRTLQVDRAEEVAADIRRALEYIPAEQPDRLDRLRVRASGVQPGHRVLQDHRDRPGVQHRARRTGSADDLCARGRPSPADRHRAEGPRSVSRARVAPRCTVSRTILGTSRAKGGAARTRHDRRLASAAAGREIRSGPSRAVGADPREPIGDRLRQTPAPWRRTPATRDVVADRPRSLAAPACAGVRPCTPMCAARASRVLDPPALLAADQWKSRDTDANARARSSRDSKRFTITCTTASERSTLPST
jgi:hypothetical protein